MIFAVVISLLIASGLTAPVKDDLERTKKSAQDEDIPVALLLVVPEKPALISEDGGNPLDLSSESALLLDSKDRATDHSLSFKDAAAASKPSELLSPTGTTGAIAIFADDTTVNAVPVLLDCSPAVESGQLAESTTPENKSVESDILAPNSPDLDDNSSDVLSVNSPSSVITSDGNERRRRNVWVENGAGRYRVSEDYPKLHKGHHHLVSEDYPQPNLIKVSSYVVESEDKP